MSQPDMIVRPKTVLAIHGAGGGGWEFNRWRWFFEAAGWSIHTPDLRPASAGLAATRLDDYLAQLRVLAGEIRPQLLVGASLGGLLAMQLAAISSVPGLVLVNPLPPAPWVAQLPARDWPEVVPWAQRHDLAATRRAMPQGHAAVAIYANTRWRDESGAVMRQAHAGVVAQLPVSTRSLLIAGALDSSVPVSVSRQFSQAIHADYLELEQADHLDPLLGASAGAAVNAALVFANSMHWRPTPDPLPNRRIRCA